MTLDAVLPVEDLTVRVRTDPVPFPDLCTLPHVAPQELGVVDVVTLGAQPVARPHCLAVITHEIVTGFVPLAALGTFPRVTITVALWKLGILSPWVLFRCLNLVIIRRIFLETGKTI